MKRVVCIAMLFVAHTGLADPCTEADLSTATVTAGVGAGSQYACKSEKASVIAQQATVGVYREDGKFLCELTAATPIRAASLKEAAATVIACNSGLGLLAVAIDKRSFWVDRNDVTLNTDSSVVTCTKQAESKSAPSPNVAVGAGEHCSTQSSGAAKP